MWKQVYRGDSQGQEEMNEKKNVQEGTVWPKSSQNGIDKELKETKTYLQSLIIFDCTAVILLQANSCPIGWIWQGNS